MTVTVTDVYAGPFMPNGVTTAFPFRFKVPSADEINVFTVADGVTTVQPAGLYSVALAPDGEGGVVNFTVAPAAALGQLFIELDPLFSQQASFNNNGFLPRTLNPNFDRSALRDLWLRERVQRSIRAPFGSAGLELTPASSGLLGVSSGDIFLSVGDDFPFADFGTNGRAVLLDFGDDAGADGDVVDFGD